MAKMGKGSAAYYRPELAVLRAILTSSNNLGFQLQVCLRKLFLRGENSAKMYLYLSNPLLHFPQVIAGPDCDFRLKPLDIDQKMAVRTEYTYVFAIGTMFAMLDAYNNVASKK